MEGQSGRVDVFSWFKFCSFRGVRLVIYSFVFLSFLCIWLIFKNSVSGLGVRKGISVQRYMQYLLNVLNWYLSL